MTERTGRNDGRDFTNNAGQRAANTKTTRHQHRHRRQNEQEPSYATNSSESAPFDGLLSQDTSHGDTGIAGDFEPVEGVSTTEGGNVPEIEKTTETPSEKKTEEDQSAVDDAVRDGLKEMHDLYFVKEPLLYKMGLYLDPEEPAARLAAFSAPNVRASLHAKYGFATVQASLKLAQRYPDNLGRQNFDFERNSVTNLLSEQCPLRGVPRCSLPSKKYRTADGTCNNIQEPWKGSSMTPMQRFLSPTYEDGIQSPRLSVFNRKLPSPRKISTTIHRDRNRSLPSITLMFMQWGQFLDHDVTATATSRAFNNSVPRCCLPGSSGFLPGEFTHPECMPIEVPHDDWFFGRFGVRCMEFIRSAPTTRINCELGWREQINQVTSYVDGSMIYGSDVGRAESLRTFRGGQLQYGRKGQRSPPDPPDGEICRTGAISTACFLGGDGRFGEQPALTALHTIWLRFHNKVARTLQHFNAHWSDEKLYQEARRIVAALVQHITYREFLPIVLGREVVDLFELKLLSKEYYAGYSGSVNPATANAFSTAAFRFGHSLVQNSFVRSTINHQRMLNNVSIHHEQDNPENIWSSGSLDRLILGLCNQPSQMRDEFIGNELTNHLFQSGGTSFGMDLAAINIQRGRDHGLPPYTSWRQPCGLAPINDWQDLSKIMPADTVRLFQSLYEHVDDIDLYSGGLAEKPVRGGMVGPVFACIIAQQFLNFRKGDRFWYENGNFKSSFTPGQLQEIRKVSLAHIICYSIGEIHNIQPFVFFRSDDDQNARTTCKELLGRSLDLAPWSEVDLNSVDFDGSFDNFEMLRRREQENFLSPQNANFLESFESEDGDFDFEKGFKQTVDALEQINRESFANVRDDKLEVLDIEDAGNGESEEMPKIFFKRKVRETNAKESDKYSLEDFIEHNLILLRNLKNIKINDYFDEELKKSPNISSEIMVLPKEDHMVKERIINDTVLLINSKQNNMYQKPIGNSTNSPSNSAPAQNQNSLKTTSRSNEADNIKANKAQVKINSFINDLFDDSYLHELNENLQNLSKENRTNTANLTKMLTNSEEGDAQNLQDYNLRELNENPHNFSTKRTGNVADILTSSDKDGIADSDDQKLRNIDEYILDTLSDYVYDEDYESDTTRKKNKNRKQSTDKPKVAKRKTTPKSTMERVTNKPDGTNFPILSDDGADVDIAVQDDEEEPSLTFMNYGQRPYDYDDDIRLTQMHQNLPNNFDPATTDDQNNPPKYQFNININYMTPTTGHTQNVDSNNNRRRITTTDKDRPLLQVTLLDNNKENDERPLKINHHSPLYGLTTKRPLTNTNYPTKNKLTYVTGYMIEGTTRRTVNSHDVPIYISNRPDHTNIFNKPIGHRHDDFAYDSVPTTKSPYKPIIVLRPQNADSNYDRPSYSTSRPYLGTTKRPNLPVYLYTYDGPYGTDARPANPDRHQIEMFNRGPTADKNDPYANYETVLHVKKPTRLTSNGHNSNDKFSGVDDKLDFKTKLLPQRLKTTGDNKKYVKISSVKGGYERAKENAMENKEAGDTDDGGDIILPELEGINVVQIDVLPSDDKYKSTTFNDTEDTSPMPLISKFYSDFDSAPELPTPMSNNKTTPPAV